jgi:hypothetical protein
LADLQDKEVWGMNQFRHRPTTGPFLILVALLTCLGAMNAPVQTSVGASGPQQFAGITTGCTFFEVAGFEPDFTFTLYNLPANSSPHASGTVSIDGSVEQLANLSFNAVPGLAGAWSAFAFFDHLAPATALFSFTWTDGVGGGGTGTQTVGVPCGSYPLAAASGMTASSDGSAYWVVTSTGGLVARDAASYASGYAFNDHDYGDLGALPLNAPVVGVAALPGGQGYWLLGADGGVFSYGLAQFYGSTGGLRLNAPVVGMASTPDGGGYWLVARDGGIFAFGDAGFFGSMGGQRLNQPIVGMAVDQATGGYWLVASDGGVFSFNAPFHGSTGSLVLNKPIVGMQGAPEGSGYRLAARDGGVFSFDLPFAGSRAGQDPNPIVGIAGSGTNGYWLLDSCGGVFSFGPAQFYGSALQC